MTQGTGVMFRRLAMCAECCRLTSGTRRILENLRNLSRAFGMVHEAGQIGAACPQRVQDPPVHLSCLRRLQAAFYRQPRQLVTEQIGRASCRERAWDSVDAG